MNTLFLVVLFEYIGIPKDAAEIIAFAIYIILCLLILGALLSITNICTYTKKANEQNDIIIKALYKQSLQNDEILKKLINIESYNTRQVMNPENNNTYDFKNDIKGFQNYYNENNIFNDHMQQ